MEWRYSNSLSIVTAACAAPSAIRIGAAIFFRVISFPIIAAAILAILVFIFRRFLLFFRLLGFQKRFPLANARFDFFFSFLDPAIVRGKTFSKFF